MKILIIEDHPTYQIKLRSVIEDIGSDFTIIDSVSQANGTFSQPNFTDSYELIVCEIHLSDGLIFEISNWPELPTVFITSFEEEDYLKSALKINRSRLIHKPFTNFTLKAAILGLLTHTNHVVQDEPHVIVFGKHRNPVKILLSDIYFVESEGNYASIYTTNDVKWSIKKPAKKIVHELGHQAFVQIQRAVYVHRPKISRVSLPENNVVVQKHILKVSKKYKPNIYEFYTGQM